MIAELHHDVAMLDLRGEALLRREAEHWRSVGEELGFMLGSDPPEAEPDICSAMLPGHEDAVRVAWSLLDLHRGFHEIDFNAESWAEEMDRILSKEDAAGPPAFDFHRRVRVFAQQLEGMVL